jgi:hypothetical protein
MTHWTRCSDVDGTHAYIYEDTNDLIVSNPHYKGKWYLLNYNRNPYEKVPKRKYFFKKAYYVVSGPFETSDIAKMAYLMQRNSVNQS